MTAIGLCAAALPLVFIAAVPTLHRAGVRDYVPLALKNKYKNVHELR